MAGVILADTAFASPAAPDPLVQPLKDGCQRNPGALLTRTSPEWTYVYNTLASQPAPPPQWVSGQVSSGNRRFAAVHTAGGDLPQGHDAYDFNLNILPDPQYSFLLGGSPNGPAGITGNYVPGGEDTARLHTEWEDLTVPKFAWPEPGDRVAERGSWVWDCGHWGTPTNIFSPDYSIPDVGQPCPTPGPLGDPSQCKITGEATEFHPYRALWDERRQSPNSPFGDREAELFVSTDKTPAGKQADCAHKHPPPPSLVLPNPIAYGPDYTACLASEPNWQDVSGHYSFLLAAPPRPRRAGRLIFRAVDHGSLGAPAPTLTREGNAVRVSFDLHSTPNQQLRMAYTIFAGWRRLPAAALPTHLRVRFDSLTVHRAMDPGCSRGAPVPGCQLESTRQNQLSTTPPGDWNLYWDVGGVWGSWAPGNGEFLAHDGEVFPGHHTVDLYVPPGKGWRLFVHGRECDLNLLDPTHPMADCPANRDLADDNDVPGEILNPYASAGASVGTHTSDARTAATDPTSTCPDANPHGCYTLRYTVSIVHDRAQRTRRGAGRCLNPGRGVVKGARLGAAHLGRTRGQQRQILKGRLLSRRRGIDRYCVAGGGVMRIGYRAARLNRTLELAGRHAMRRQALIALTTSKRFVMRGVRVGDGTRRLRTRLEGRLRRYRIGRSRWYVASGRQSRLLFKTRRRRVIELGIASKLLTRTPPATRTFLEAWHL